MNIHKLIKLVFGLLFLGIAVFIVYLLAFKTEYDKLGMIELLWMILFGYYGLKFGLILIKQNYGFIKEKKSKSDKKTIPFYGLVGMALIYIAVFNFLDFIFFKEQILYILHVPLLIIGLILAIRFNYFKNLCYGAKILIKKSFSEIRGKHVIKNILILLLFISFFLSIAFFPLIYKESPMNLELYKELFQRINFVIISLLIPLSIFAIFLANKDPRVIKAINKNTKK